MKIILTLSFFFLLLISCNNEKEKNYPITSIRTYTSDNIENKTINSAYKDSSTLIMSSINTITKEMSSYLFSRTYFDSVRTTYSKTTIWTVNPPNDKGGYYYYSESTSIDNTTRNSSKTITNSVSLHSKNEIPYQKRLELLAWPMNQLMFISTKKDSIITGSYSSDSISYQYKVKNRSKMWLTGKEDAFFILKNTNDTTFMSLTSSSSSSSSQE
jgi:hypothetical protein